MTNLIQPLSTKRAMTSQQSLTEILSKLERSRFFGALEIKFEAGRVVLLRQTETIKLDDCRDNRGDHEQSKQCCSSSS